MENDRQRGSRGVPQPCPGQSATADNPFGGWIRLEQPRLGTRVTWASDEFFAQKERLIDPAPPVFVADRYDDHGKWMDGWETRRRRTPGHEACIVRLGTPGVVRGVDIDTRFFTGNFPAEASLDACVSDEDVPQEAWQPLLAKQPLDGDAHHFVAIEDNRKWTHIRLNIYPDGGIARLRIYGEARPLGPPEDGSIDLLALRNGGRAIAASDEHYGSAQHLNLPGRAVNAGDGWHTARRRTPGNEWVILALGWPGVIERAEVDTGQYKGSHPECVSLEAAAFETSADVTHDSDRWRTLLPESKVSMDKKHYFEDQLADLGPVTHVRLSVYPDGGVSRLRLFGRASAASG